MVFINNSETTFYVQAREMNPFTVYNGNHISHCHERGLVNMKKVTQIYTICI